MYRSVNTGFKVAHKLFRLSPTWGNLFVSMFAMLFLVETHLRTLMVWDSKPRIFWTVFLSRYALPSCKVDILCSSPRQSNVSNFSYLPNIEII